MQAKNFSDVAQRFALLSDRQQQVTTLVCGGLSNKEIAKKLGVSEGTVKAHLHAVYEKLRFHSRTEIIIASKIVQIRSLTD
jgi:RNA polymerase sigma factor (sigma-70 family)